MLARPNITAVSGETASFFSGGEYPLPSGIKDGLITFDYKKYGVLLDFVPTVINSKRIALTVRPEVSQRVGTDSLKILDAEIPVIDVRRAETTIEVGNGESIVIAGLYRNQSDSTEAGVPGLKDIPKLGLLFGTRTSRSNSIGAHRRGHGEADRFDASARGKQGEAGVGSPRPGLSLLSTGRLARRQKPVSAHHAKRTRAGLKPAPTSDVRFLRRRLQGQETLPCAQLHESYAGHFGSPPRDRWPCRCRRARRRPSTTTGRASLAPRRPPRKPRPGRNSRLSITKLTTS